MGNKSSAPDKHRKEAGDAENQAGDFHGERRKMPAAGGCKRKKSIRVEGRLWETLGFIASFEMHTGLVDNDSTTSHILKRLAKTS